MATFNGTSGNDSLLGGTANDQLFGLAGNDTLNGGAGNDTMRGGAGNDVYLVDSSADVLVESNNEGTDTVHSSVSWTLGNYFENLTLTGSANLNATGNSLANVLVGNAGNNTLNGGTGADTLRGGAGNDLYVVDNVGDVVIENLNEGLDSVQSSITYTLGANLENLTLTGTSAIHGTGNAQNNTLVGNTAANRLSGGDGDDTLAGGSGNDTLDGGTGNDSLDGGVGNDSMRGGAGNDTYVVNATTDVIVENLGEGIDTVQSSVTLTLGANLERLTLAGTSAINGTGNLLDNVIVGNGAANLLTGGAGNDTLDGGAGGDTLRGGTGDDTYVIDAATDAISENAGEGLDTVRSSVSHALGANLENLTLIGTAAVNATGNAFANVLTGNEGNNRLDGGAGNDTMLGGAGNDTYVIDSGDIVIENADAGIDTIETAQTHVLAAGFENLTLTGTAAIDGTGNAASNVLVGNSAANVLLGDGGADTLLGGAGADRLDSGAGDDVVSGGDGNDTIHSLWHNTYGYAGGGNDTLKGDAGDDVLHGTDGVSVMTGGTGNDTLNGYDGSDTYVFNAGDGHDSIGEYDWFAGAADTDTLEIRLAAGQTADDVVLTRVGRKYGELEITIDGTSDQIDVRQQYDSGDWTYTAGIEQIRIVAQGGNVTLLDSDAIGAARWEDVPAYVGSEQGEWLDGRVGVTDVVAGQGGNDTIYGYAGNDSLSGGAGDDHLDSGSGDDIVSGGDGNDTIYSLWHNTYGYAGGGNDTLQGDAGDDVLHGTDVASVMSGGTGNDTLNGYDGSDTYVFNSGDGQDTIGEYDWFAAAADTDTLQINLAAGQTADDVVLMRVGADFRALRITIDGTSDRIDVPGQYDSGDWTYTAGIEQIVIVEASGTVTTLGVEQINAAPKEGQGNNGTDGDDILLGTPAADLLDGRAGNDQLWGGGSGDSLIGGTGDDRFFVDSAADAVVENANEGRDTVHSSVSYALGSDVENLVLTGAGTIAATGNALDNAIFGNAGDNLIDGGAGNDLLNGRGGNDTYLFGYGSGHDRIYDTQQYANYDGQGEDTVQLGAGITERDVTVTRGAGSDIVLTLVATGETLTFADGELPEGSSVVRFADGKTWGNSYLYDLAQSSTPGTDAPVTFVGTPEYDSFTGGSGNDTILGNGGGGYFETGGGDDYIDVGGPAWDTHAGGGAGSDTYVFGRGYGRLVIYDGDYSADFASIDTIRMADDITRDDLRFSRDSGGELRIEIIGTDDHVYIPLQYSFPQHGIERLIVGGEEIDLTTLDVPINGTGGTDYLRGGVGHDTFDGQVESAAGTTDLLRSGGGADTVVFGHGYGFDLFLHVDYFDAVAEAPGPVTVRMNDDVVMEEVTLARSANQLYVSLNGGADMLVLPYSPGFAGSVASIVFADERSFGPADFDALPLSSMTRSGSEAAEYLYGAADGDAVSGGDGNDGLYGLGGADTLDGGAGDDVIYSTPLYGAVAGNSVLLGGLGNDWIYGEGGSDTLDGGAGNDYLNGASGADVILFGPGSGNDTVGAPSGYADYGADGVGQPLTIQITGGLVPEQVVRERVGNDLVLRLLETSDSLTVDEFFTNDGWFNATNVRVDFGGTTWSAADLSAGLGGYGITLVGSEFDDYPLVGTAGDDQIDGAAGNDNIYGSFGDDTLHGGAGDDYLFKIAGNGLLYGGDGNDNLMASQGHDSLYGEAGDDYLSSSMGDNYFDGGVGNDNIGGGIGSDVYVFGRGYGVDRVLEGYSGSSGTDVIRMLSGVSADDLVLQIVPQDEHWALSIRIKDTNDELIVQEWQRSFGDGASGRIERIEFVDGGSIDLTQALIPMIGTDASEQIRGSALADLIDAGGGIDYIRGDAGNDVYVFAPGHGDDVIIDRDTAAGNLDTIRVEGSLLPAQVTLFRDAANLYLSIDGSEDRIRVLGHFESADSKVERIEFASTGEVWDLAVLDAAPLGATPAFVGTAGRDANMDGTDGADVLDGRGGREYLRGGLGDDVYIYGRGYGDDDIEELDPTAGNVDTVRFAADVAPEDVYFSRDSRGPLVMQIRGDVEYVEGIGDIQRELRVWDHFEAPEYQIERVEFADGTVVELAELNLAPFYDQSDVGTDGNDLMQRAPESEGVYPDYYEFDGAAGNDLVQSLGIGGAISGGTGNDLMIGGAGDNRIDAGSGADIVAFNRGDGNDTLAASAGNEDTLSLGGIASSELAFSRSGDDLRLDVGLGESITFEGWYTGSDAQSIAELQLITESAVDFDVQTFDFAAIVGSFDQALTADPSLTEWELSNAMLDFRLGSSDTAAIGGDLAYQYAVRDSLTDISVVSAHAVTDSSLFGFEAQTLNPLSSLQMGFVDLA